MNTKQLIEYVNKFKTGDQKSFAYLYQISCDALYAYAESFSNSDEEAVTLMRRAYVKSAGSIGELTYPEDFFIWLREITYKLAGIKFRVDGSEVSDEDEQAAKAFEKISSKNNAELEQLSGNAESLYSILRNLPVRQKLLLTSYYIDGQSVQEISEITGMNELETKRRLFYALTSFKNRIEAHDEKNDGSQAKIDLSGAASAMTKIVDSGLIKLNAGDKAKLFREIIVGAGLDIKLSQQHDEGSSKAAAGIKENAADRPRTDLKRNKNKKSVKPKKKISRNAVIIAVVLVIAAVVAAIVVLGRSKTNESDSNSEVKEAYTAYKEVLEEHKDMIKETSWQNTAADAKKNLRKTHDGDTTALCDINGDGIPELFYLAADPETEDGYGQNYDAANLFIYTYKNGFAQEVSYELEDTRGIDDNKRMYFYAGGVPVPNQYGIYKGKKKGTLYFYDTHIDEIMDDEIWKYKFSMGDDEESPSLKCVSTMNHDGSGYNYISKSTPDDKETKKYVDDVGKNIDSVILNSIWYDSATDYDGYRDTFGYRLQNEIGNLKPLSKSYDDMITFLDENGRDEGKEVLPANTKLFFSSGAGGWGTTVFIHKDGTFSGNWRDYDLGLTGEDYPNGTVHMSEFRGSFDNIKKVGKYEYSMRLKNIKYANKLGNHEIKHGIYYDYGDAYGFEEGKEYRFYLPGMVNDEFKSWYMQRVEEMPKKLPCYALRNVKMNYGFFSNSGW